MFQSTYLFHVLQYALIRPSIKFITQFKSDLDQCWRTILQLKPIDSSSKVATLGRLKIVMKFVSYSPVIFRQISEEVFLCSHVQWNIYVGCFKIFSWGFLTSFVGQGSVMTLGRSRYHFCECRVHISKKSESHNTQVWELGIATPQRIPQLILSRTTFVPSFV